MSNRKISHRLDAALLERGLAPDIERARALIMAGLVLVNSEPTLAADLKVLPDDLVALKDRTPYVSRGGLKLVGALDAFGIDPRDQHCADVGSSTGGFTDVLLQRAAKRVYAIDVGYGELAWKLRSDNRVNVMERTNARELEQLPGAVGLIVSDLSFISLRLLWARFEHWLDPDGAIVALVKPQFEAPIEQVPHGGVVLDPKVHREVLIRVLEAAEKAKLFLHGAIPSPIKGGDGNTEFLVHLRKIPNSAKVDLNRLIDRALKLAQKL